MGKRACFPVRMQPSERDRIAAAAKARRQSMCAFMVQAALEAAGERELGATCPSEALSGLHNLGYTPGDAKSAVRRFLEAEPDADTEQILAGVLREKGKALCQSQ